jgi:hypothetical protein
MADDTHQYEASLAQAETALRRLRALYDQFFQGVERVEPRIPREEMERLLQRLGRGQPRNTALRFRYNQLRQRFLTYNTYWKRISRQIEEGTYKRDVLRAQRRRRAPESIPPEPPPVEADVADAVDGAAAGGSVPPGEISPFAHPGAKKDLGRASVPMPPPTPGRTKHAPRPAAKGGAANAGMQKLFDRYLDARKSNGERVDNLSYDKLMKSVNQMVPKLKAKHPGKRIGFEVVVRDGKVALKPVAK